MNYKVTKTNAPANSDIFQEDTGCELFTIDGELYISGADSQEHADSLIATHQTARLAKKTEQDAERVQFEKDRASAEAKLEAVLGLTKAEIKAYRKDK